MKDQPLTFEQYQILHNQGLSPEQIASFESGYIPHTSIPELQNAYQAQKESNQSTGRIFASELGKNLLQKGVGNIPRFLTSAALAPVDIVRGFMGKEPISGTAKFPGLQPFQTFQSEAAQNINRLGSETTPDTLKTYASAAKPFLEVPAAGLETLGTGKLLQSAPEKLESTFQGAKRIFQGYADKKSLAKIGSQAAFDESLKITQPQLTAAGEKEAFKQGRIGERTLFKSAPVTPSKVEQKVAEAVQPLVEQNLVSKSNSITQNRNVISQYVSKINGGVKQLLADYGSDVSEKTLDKAIKNSVKENELIFAGDASAERAYEGVANKFKEFLKTFDVSGQTIKEAGKESVVQVNPAKYTNTENLFEARQAFDTFMKRKFPNVFKQNQLGFINPADNARYHAILDMRGVANGLISESLPANNPYKFAIQNEHQLLRAIDQMSTKITGLTKTGTVGAFLKRHPVASGIAGGVALEEIARNSANRLFSSR